MKANQVIINIDFLKKVIRLKNLKRDWLASQMLINPKTISRWTTGKVKHTDISTIFRLSQIIECAPEELIIDESASSEASISTLKDSLIDANLPLMVSPSDNWSLLDVFTWVSGNKTVHGSQATKWRKL